MAVPLLLLAPRDARAGIAACNDIDVRASARCEVVTSGGCTAQCEPARFEAACNAQLTAQCDGECSASVDATCTAACEGTCTGQCTADPGSLDCQGSCEGSCNADCDAECQGQASSNTASGACKAKCSASCNAKCTASCTGTEPNASCDAKCRASCQGSCRAKANARCQIDCQSRLDADCKARLEGGCRGRCERPEGALFCDGQYVDTGDNLQRCIDALRAQLNIQVSGSASSSCSGNQCTAEAEGTASCAASPNTAPVTPAFAVLGLVGLTVARSIRRRRR
ncbi:MAG: hypothetical protein KIT84_02270 [Labilithrix sp.]|nr:hypothetical protein [Labilithrix sp.]MCW5809810.1 hypothetical protein [Labilithrix sp.]